LLVIAAGLFSDCTMMTGEDWAEGNFMEDSMGSVLSANQVPPAEKECFMAAKDWIPKRDIEPAAFAQVWKTGLSSQATVDAFGWKTADVDPAFSRITAFPAAWDDYSAVIP
jgi:hypothetical protein